MNKTKKELYVENKKLKEERKMYREFWEIDLLKEQRKQLNFVKRYIWAIAIMFLCLTCLLIGIMIG